MVSNFLFIVWMKQALKTYVAPSIFKLSGVVHTVLLPVAPPLPPRTVLIPPLPPRPKRRNSKDDNSNTSRLHQQQEQQQHQQHCDINQNVRHIQTLGKTNAEQMDGHILWGGKLLHNRRLSCTVQCTHRAPLSQKIPG